MKAGSRIGIDTRKQAIFCPRIVLILKHFVGNGQGLIKTLASHIF